MCNYLFFLLSKPTKAALSLRLLSAISFSLFLVINVNSQSTTIDSIYILGNNRTKRKVIVRELTFYQNYILSEDDDLKETEKYNEKRLLSLGLFNEVSVSFKPSVGDNHVNALIIVNENWYIYPSPIFELADRNFNLWWYELNRDLKRVNYGLRAEHINLSGNRDKLSLTFQVGYTRKLELKYHFPFLDSAGKWSTSINAFYSDVKEIAYKTLNNKTQFGRFNEEIMLSRLRIGGDLGYRPSLYSFHGFRLEYHRNKINDFAASELNPEYFLNGITQNQFLFFNYTYFLDKREFIIYPEGGYFFLLNAKKEGLYVYNDYDNLPISLEFEQYFSFKSKLLWNYSAKIKGNLIRNKLAFSNNSALGWGNDVLRGYEIYAIDGSDYFYFKTGIHYKFFENTYDISNFLPLSQFNKIDLKLYLSFGFDTGYVNERDYIETNTFNNRWLYGYGPSFNFMLYNTYLFKIDYSINHTGEGGIYLSNKISF